MNLGARIEVVGDAEKIYKCFKPELIKKDRSEYTIRKSKGKIIFEVSAKDPVALRATLNSITQMLTIFEKMKEIK
jgi:tRNA threonylcarbamoyladenosine modification (KEOPS) complex  Pcc1 subunit